MKKYILHTAIDLSSQAHAKCCFSGKLTRHKVGCDKRFKEAKNQEPSHDWEPPAKIPKPINYGSRVNPGASLLNRQHHQNTAILNQAARGALQVTIFFRFTLHTSTKCQNKGKFTRKFPRCK